MREKSRLCGKNGAALKEWLRVTELSPPNSSEEHSQKDDPDMMWTSAVPLLLLLPRLLLSTVRMSCPHTSELH